MTCTSRRANTPPLTVSHCCASSAPVAAAIKPFSEQQQQTAINLAATSRRQPHKTSRRAAGQNATKRRHDSSATVAWRGAAAGETTSDETGDAGGQSGRSLDDVKRVGADQSVSAGTWCDAAGFCAGTRRGQRCVRTNHPQAQDCQTDDWNSPPTGYALNCPNVNAVDQLHSRHALELCFSLPRIRNKLYAALKNNHILGIPDPSIHIQYATLLALRWRLSVVHSRISPLLSVFRCNSRPSYNNAVLSHLLRLKVTFLLINEGSSLMK